MLALYGDQCEKTERTRRTDAPWDHCARFAKFIADTGHTTFAEIPPNPADYPGALAHMLYAGSLVFHRPTGPVDRGDIGNWWSYIAAPTADTQRRRASCVKHRGDFLHDAVITKQKP
jgi:hypothetical protein